MRALLAVFRKEWTEARRDPRAWLLTLVVPLFFYPGVALIGFGSMGVDGSLRVASDDAQLRQELAELPGLSVTSTDAADLFVVVSARDPGFPETGSLWLEFNGPGGMVAVQRFQLAIDEWSGSIIRERAGRAGVAERDLKPVRRVAPVTGESGTASPFGGEIIAYLLVFLMFTGSLATAVDSGAGERERGGLEALLATPVNPLHLAAGKVAFILLTGLASVAASLAGLSIAAALGGGLPVVAAAKWSAVLPTALLLLACGGFTASCLFACSLGARSAREAHAWISGVFLLVSLGLVWVTFGGGGGAWGAWLPLFGATEAIAATLGGQTGFAVWLPPLLATSAGGVLATLWCMRLLRREAVLRAW
jgi:ABC-type Na+ efflux pump permease subunit